MNFLTLKKETEDLGFTVYSISDEHTILSWGAEEVVLISEKMKDTVTFTTPTFIFSTKELKVITDYIATDIKGREPYEITQGYLIETAASKILGITIWEDDLSGTYKVLEDLIKDVINLKEKEYR